MLIFRVHENTVDWLLEDDNPPVRFLTLKNLLGYQDSSPFVQAACNSIMNYELINVILDDRKRYLPKNSKVFKPYQKYRGFFWQVIFLGDFLANASDDRVRECCEAVLSIQGEKGGFTPSLSYNYEIVCLTGNILRALAIMGYADHPDVLKEYENLAQRIIWHNGVPCKVQEYSVYPSCFMTAPRTLRAFAAFPENFRTDTIRKAMGILIDGIYQNRIYRYVRSNARQYEEALKISIKSKGGRTTPEEKEAFRIKFLEDNPGEVFLGKKGWKRFAFPIHYNSNLLESVVALIEAGDVRTNDLTEAVEIIIKKQRPDGRWKMDDSLNGKMIVNVEEKGKPSKWITYFSLFALKNVIGIENINDVH